jgi:hypothetical protein
MMKKLTMLAAAMSMCLGAAVAQDGMKDHHWGTDHEAMFRICRTLNGGEQWAIMHELGELPGSFEHVYYMAINKASEDNGGAIWGNGTSANTTMGTENQTMAGGDSMYAMTYQQRMRKGITDGQALDLLYKGVPDSDRGIIAETWPHLTDTCQMAILHVIKRSPLITPVTDSEMNWWK